MASSTRARVAGATTWGRFSTFDTVPTDTPALTATSRMLELVAGALMAPSMPYGRLNRTKP